QGPAAPVAGRRAAPPRRGVQPQGLPRRPAAQRVAAHQLPPAPAGSRGGLIRPVLVIPAIDLEKGRSRVVFWPGAATGVGAPTDRPERIAKRFVELGARLVHLVD